MKRIMIIAGLFSAGVAMGAKNPATKRGYVLVAALRSDSELSITLKGCEKPLSVKVIDPIRDLEKIDGWTWDDAKGALRIPRGLGDSSVWLVEVEVK